MAKYVPIKTILYDLSLSLDPSEWNTSVVTEWALKASRKMGGVSLFKDNIEWYQIVDHTLKVPSDLKVINQIEVYKQSLTYNTAQNATLIEKIRRRTDHPHQEIFVEATEGHKGSDYRPVYKSTGHFINACNYENIGTCVPEYREETNLLRFSFREGIVAINYLGYAKDGKDYLIPDIEDYKEAIRYYILYRIYDTKCRVETTQFNIAERDRNYKMYTSLAMKAVGKVNEASIDTNTMENLKNMRSRMISRSNLWEQGFANLGKPESGKLF